MPIRNCTPSGILSTRCDLGVNSTAFAVHVRYHFCVVRTREVASRT